MVTESKIMNEKPVYILYGSQTGNAESIAKGFAHTLVEEEDIKCHCETLNSMKNKPLQEMASCVLIICATTGNGDAPENVDGWWRGAKLRSAPKDKFKGVNFAVLGLGDTNYDKFCHMGNMIDKRLAELGGDRKLALACADEATNMEDVVEDWKSNATRIVKEILAAPIPCALPIDYGGEETKGGEAMCAVAEPKLNDVKSSGDNETVNKNNKIKIKDELPVTPSSMPSEVMNLSQIADMLEVGHLLDVPIEPSKLPKFKKFSEKDVVYSLAAEVEGSNESKGTFNDSNDSFIDTTDHCSDYPLDANVLEAQWLSNTHELSKNSIISDEWSLAKRVIRLDISVKRANFFYSTGDSIGLCVPNPPYLVDIVVDRLKSVHGQGSINLDSSIFNASSGKVVPLRDLLMYKFDLVGIPRKAFVLALSQYCSAERDANLMKFLCSKGDLGKKLWGQFVEAQMLGTGEILALFPSCAPSVSQFFSCLSNLPPRFYSIASSPLIDPHKLSIAFSVVHNSCRVTTSSGEGPLVKRYGLATSYLESILAPWLRPTVSTNQDGMGRTPAKKQTQVKIFHKPSISFHLPGSVGNPLIFIGPGTGVSPFIGFLQQRRELERERLMNSGGGTCTGCWHGSLEFDEKDLPSECNYVDGYIQSLEPGPIHMFFGCRNEGDYLYKNELLSYVNDRTLTSLDVAMSRLDGGADKRYVTHCIADRGRELVELIMNESAHIFICGDGNKMAKDVYAVFLQALVDYGGPSVTNEEQADAYLKEMRVRHRYLLDIWS